jgi:CDP-diglyceride synthetase
LFWLMLGGFIWVVGDVFQQYAAKYVGISRGIPLSNSNQLWGLLWGIFVFGELRGSGVSTYMQVVGGSLLMMLGVGAIAFSSAAGKEQAHWQEASQRESRRYNIAEEYVEARMQGRQMAGEVRPQRTVWDWILVAVATGIFVFFATLARAPRMAFHWGPAMLLIAATVALLLVCGSTLWRTTRFN